MNDLREKWNEMLDPPAGGVASMQQRIAQPPPRSYSAAWASGVLATAAALVAVLFYTVPQERQADIELADAFSAPEFDRLLGRRSAEQPLRIQMGEQTFLVRELPSTDPNVKIYELPCNKEVC